MEGESLCRIVILTFGFLCFGSLLDYFYVTAALDAVWPLVNLHFFSLQFTALPLQAVLIEFTLMIFSCHSFFHILESQCFSSASVLSSSFFLYSGVFIHSIPHLTP